jgi:hypothetical protein
MYMNVILYLVLIGMLFVFMSQTSYARIIANVDFTASERKVHCVHHAVHALCALLEMVAVIGILKGDCQVAVLVLCSVSCGLLAADALAFAVLNRTRQFALRRDAIRLKWKGEKVFGPEHDHEVSVFRTLKEITEKNVLRDGLHMALAAALGMASLL